MNNATPEVSDEERARAKAFFRRLENYLATPAPTNAVLDEILRAKSGLKPDGNKAKAYEEPFFKAYVVPAVYEFLKTIEHLGHDAAKQSLLAQGYLGLKNYTSGTPASKAKYPYKKTLANTLRTARRDWWSDGKVLSNSCPDLALRSPCDFSVVFEGKLFRSGGVEAAKSAIVDGIYECFFYRALPTLRRLKGQSASGYDYSCFLAYDASPDGSMKTAWENIREEVDRSLWESLNIYVMIFRVDGK